MKTPQLLAVRLNGKLRVASQLGYLLMGIALSMAMAKL
jgi:hypothetical protein